LACCDLLFNWLLVSVYGDDEMFLYSQHWFLPVCVIVLAACASQGKRWFGPWLLIAITAGAILSSIFNFTEIVMRVG
jgi:hypothetical protein